jgi:peptidoglycan/xylan/chitin deacetylase (PgdA/CDA1 family)
VAPHSRLALLGALLLLAPAIAACAPKKSALGSQIGNQDSAAQLQTADPLPPVPAPPPYQPLNLASLSQRVPVLTYHGVIKSRSQSDAVWFDCTADEFEAQMKFLQDQGANVITLPQLRRHLTLGEPLPGKAIALTFDDSYQGVYDYAAPILTRYGYPYAIFPHTDYVGSQKGRPKMSWDELRALDRSGLVTFGSHSRSHPADMGLLTQGQQDEELQGSKTVLERELGHPVSFISYPNGKADAATFERARAAGYTLGFMEEWGPAEQSPGILALNRYIHLQLPRAWAENFGAVETAREVGYPAPRGLDVLPASAVLPLTTGTLNTEQTVAAGVPLTLSSGGTLTSEPAGRLLGSGDFVPASGEGLNIWITSHAAGGVPLGPYQMQGGAFVPEPDPDRLKLVLGRPLVAWNAERLAFLPFAPGMMNDDAALKALLPGLKGAFVAGAWLVQGGEAMSSQGILSTGTSDLRTLRRRVFLGMSAAGTPMLGVTRTPVTARQLALAAAAAGAQDAVLVY